jgi:hypothetical protein
VPLSRFDLAAQTLSERGKQNIRILRNWARSKGWIKKPTTDGPEVWGIQQQDIFSWRLKIKPEVSTRPGLESSSQKPRFDARLDDKGTYINPLTGQTGNRKTGTHLDLE